VPSISRYRPLARAGLMFARRAARRHSCSVTKEMMMRRLFSNIGWAGMAVLFTAMSLSAVPAAAEKREQTYVKKNFRTASKSVIPVADGRELVHEVTVADIQYSNPDFKVLEEWNHTQSNLLNGSGTHSGFFADTHVDGSRTFGEFVGKVKSLTKSDGAWELTYEGTYKYLGGTGKFKNIKGGGTYKGVFSSADYAGVETGQETVEY
jgi:hypothetical protein